MAAGQHERTTQRTASMEKNFMTNQKDSDEVMEFLHLFSELKRVCGGEPKNLSVDAPIDDKIFKICSRLYWLSEDFEGHADLVDPALPWIAPVSREFISAWRQFNEHYSDAVMEITWGKGYLDALKEEALAEGVDPALSREKIFNEMSFRVLSEVSDREMQSIIDMFSAVSDLLQDKSMHPVDEAIVALRKGIDVWGQLNPGLSVELARHMKRRKLIPKILINRHISGAGDRKEQALLNLYHAVQAFLWGADLAAIAMIRATLESLLRQLYDGTGNLESSINLVEHKLPQRANKYALHHIRVLANKVLHGEPDDFSASVAARDDKLEREIVRFLVILKELIEAAPE